MNELQLVVNLRASLRHLNEILEEAQSPYRYDVEPVAGTDMWTLYKYNGKQCSKASFADAKAMYKVIYVLKDAFRPE